MLFISCIAFLLWDCSAVIWVPKQMLTLSNRMVMLVRSDSFMVGFQGGWGLDKEGVPRGSSHCCAERRRPSEPSVPSRGVKRPGWDRKGARAVCWPFQKTFSSPLGPTVILSRLSAPWGKGTSSDFPRVGNTRCLGAGSFKMTPRLRGVTCSFSPTLKCSRKRRSAHQCASRPAPSSRPRKNTPTPPTQGVCENVTSRSNRSPWTFLAVAESSPGLHK